LSVSYVSNRSPFEITGFLANLSGIVVCLAHVSSKMQLHTEYRLVAKPFVLMTVSQAEVDHTFGLLTMMSPEKLCGLLST
jgi:hypothetical protein